MDWTISRTRLVTDLQHKYAGRHTQNSVFITKSAEHYKDIVFTYGNWLHATIKDADQCITCLLMKPNNMIHIKYALGFCGACPECNIPDEELDDVPNVSSINFSVYTCQ